MAIPITRRQPSRAAHTEDQGIVSAREASSVKAMTFGELRQAQFPPRAVLLRRGDTAILQAGHLAEIYAERGAGKTWFTRSLALAMASGGSALGFQAPQPCRVLYLDGEMASEEIQERDAHLERVLTLPNDPRLMTIASDWQDNPLPPIDSPDGQAAIAAWVDWADVVIVDNRSCLFNPEGEKDPTAWQPALVWLLSLRRRNKAVILVHHANRAGGARGIGKAEDQLNLIIELALPDDFKPEHGARFVLSYRKTRSIRGGVALKQVEARLTDTGWVYSTLDQSPIERAMIQLVNDRWQLGSPVQTMTEAKEGCSKGNKQDRVAAWKRLLVSGALVQATEGFKVA